MTGSKGKERLSLPANVFLIIWLLRNMASFRTRLYLLIEPWSLKGSRLLSSLDDTWPNSTAFQAKNIDSRRGYSTSAGAPLPASMANESACRPENELVVCGTRKVGDSGATTGGVGVPIVNDVVLDVGRSPLLGGELIAVERLSDVAVRLLIEVGGDVSSSISVSGLCWLVRLD